MIYSYVARDTAGKKIVGILEAEREAEVLQDLLGRSLTPLKVELRKQVALAVDFTRFARVPVATQLRFFQSLSFMLDAPLSINKALNIGAERCDNKKYATAIRAVISDVQNGNELWRAMERRPREFSGLQTAMVRAGEKAGALPTVLSSVAVMLDNEYAINQQIKGSLTQPMIILVVGLLAIIGVFIGVVPKMQEFLTVLRTPLPPATQFVIGMSQVMLSPFFWLILFGTIFGAWFGFSRAMANPDFAYRFSVLFNKVPVIGTLSNQVVVARVARILATLLSASVPQDQALLLIEPLAGGEMYRRALVNIRNSVREGASLTDAFEKEAVFDPMLVSMIGVGEQTGGVHNMLSQVAIFLDREVKKKLESLTKIIEPAASVVIGGSVGGVLIALYLPYYAMLSGFTNLMQ
jgi:type IV pilus assembly protein PilC